MSLRPSRFVRAIGLPFVCLAMFAVAGGHWALLQGVAWTQMVWTYTQSEGSFKAGVAKTFSGKAPCAMCRKVEAARQSEEKAPATVKVDKKAEMFLEIFASAHQPPSQPFSYALPAALAFATRADAPPAPVPIGALS